MGPERARSALEHSIRYRCSVIYEPHQKPPPLLKDRKTTKRRSPKREVLRPNSFALTEDQIEALRANGELAQTVRLYDELNQLWFSHVQNHADKGRPMSPQTHLEAAKQIQDIQRRRGIEVAIASVRKTLQGGYLRILEETESEELERQNNA
jgi:hypothetical protein